MCPIHHQGRDAKQARDKLRLTTFRLKAFVWDGSDTAHAEGFCFVSDFSKSGVGLYLSDKIPAGNNLRVAFEASTSTTYRATVMWANRVAFRQRFLGHEALSYRVGLRFLFGSEAERQRYLKYLEEIRAKVLQIEPGLKF